MVFGNNSFCCKQLLWDLSLNKLHFYLTRIIISPLSPLIDGNRKNDQNSPLTNSFKSKAEPSSLASVLVLINPIKTLNYPSTLEDYGLTFKSTEVPWFPTTTIRFTVPSGNCNLVRTN